MKWPGADDDDKKDKEPAMTGSGMLNVKHTNDDGPGPNIEVQVIELQLMNVAFKLPIFTNPKAVKRGTVLTVAPLKQVVNTFKKQPKVFVPTVDLMADVAVSNKRRKT